MRSMDADELLKLWVFADEHLVTRLQDDLVTPL